MKLHYQTENLAERNKPWIVLINGLFTSLQSWDTIVPMLTPYFRVLRYDCRGQGESPKPTGPYTLEQHTEDLLELLNDLQIPKCSLLGISNGGRIALNFSKLYPERVRLQIVADTYYQVSDLMRMKLESWKDANRQGGPLLRFAVASPWIWGESFLNENKELVAFYKKRAGLVEDYVIDALIDGALDGKIDLNQEEIPTLMLVGDEDLLTPLKHHQEMISFFSNGRLSVVKGGHASLLEYPHSIEETVIPYIKDYL